MTDINPGQLGETINWKADRDLKNLDSTGTGFVIQPGTIIIWPGTTVPDGYLLCDGSAISRTTYAALFAVIGTTYGPGDSSGTFNLPNFINRYAVGYQSVGTYISESLPNINATFYATLNGYKTGTGAVTVGGAINQMAFGGGGGYPDVGDHVFVFNAQASNPVYQDSAAVRPSSVGVLYIIKY